MKVFISVSDDKEPTAEEAVAYASKVLSEQYKKEYPNIKSVMALELGAGGTKYRRISREELVDGKKVSSSAYGFVDQQGNLWKAASWSAPAKNKPRGTLKDLMDDTKLKSRWMYSIR